MECSLSQNSMIRAYESDLTGHISPAGVLIRMQEIAEDHAIALGIGRADMVDGLGIVWMLTQARIEFDEYPTTAQKVITKTWPAAIERLYYPRSYSICDEKSGKALIRCMTNYVLFHLPTRKLLRSNAIDAGYTPEDIPIATQPIARLRMPKDMEYSFSRKVQYSDCDMNIHMNNAMYANWICDMQTPDFIRTHKMKTLDITYSKEAAIGESIDIYTKNEGDEEYICGKIGEYTIFSAKVLWKKYPWED